MTTSSIRKPIMKRLAIILSLSFSFLLFQNCGENFTAKDVDLSSCDDEFCTDEINSAGTSCGFDGREVYHGAAAQAFLTSVSNDCEEKELRGCEDGELSGSYNYTTCSTEKDAKKACLFNGRTILDSESVFSYKASSVATGETCEQEVRTCEDGVLTGSYKYATCDVNAPKSCLFGNKTLEHSQYVKAYKYSAVTSPERCKSQNRICNNGTLKGSFTYSSCTVDTAEACLLNGVTIPHGGKTIAFAKETDSNCVKEERSCDDGELSGSYTYSSCTPIRIPASTAKSCTLGTKTIAHNASIKSYSASSVNYGKSCSSQTRTCNDGTLSGSTSYSHLSCTVGAAPKSCSLNGKTIAHNASIKSYSASSVDYGKACSSQTRTCNDGTLSGNASYSHLSCTVGAAPKSCSLDGKTIAHGSSIKAYISSSVAYGGICKSQTRTCTNGSLSGSYPNSSCSVSTAASCSIQGKVIAHGQSATFYKSPSVAYNLSCLSESRRCTNGVASGSYLYTSCSKKAAPKSCTIGNQTIEDGKSAVFYKETAAPSGGSCSPQTRRCFNGTLTGTYTHTACREAAPQSCKLDGKTVAHGKTITAYSHSSVTTPTKCSSRASTLTCNNGSIFNSSYYKYSSCTEKAAPTTPTNTSCTHDGITLKDGEGIHRYVSVVLGLNASQKVKGYSNISNALKSANSGCFPATYYCQKGKIIGVHTKGGNTGSSSKCGNVIIGKVLPISTSSFITWGSPSTSSNLLSNYPIPSTPYRFGDK